MKLSIVIPYHNEDHFCGPLLHSIDGQIGINFDDIEIIISNDCPMMRPLNFDLYPHIVSRIRYIQSEFESNIGLSRQTGLNNATGDYVIFCDSDDLLSTAVSLHDAMDEIEKQGFPDLMHFYFVKEDKDKETGKFTYSVKKENITWVFGKAYKISFLRENHIYFSEELKYHEDTYFNNVVTGFKPVEKVAQLLLYIWRYADTTITRKDNFEYTHSAYWEYIKALDLSIAKIRASGQFTSRELTLMLGFIG